MRRKRIFKVVLFLFVLLGLSAAVVSANSTGSNACANDPECIQVDNPGNSGMYSAPGEIYNFCIVSDQGGLKCWSPPGDPEGANGCYKVQFSWQAVQWTQVSDECGNVAYIKVYYRNPVTPTPPGPTPTPGSPTPTPEAPAAEEYPRVHLNFDMGEGWPVWGEDEGELHRIDVVNYGGSHGLVASFFEGDQDANNPGNFRCKQGMYSMEVPSADWVKVELWDAYGNLLVDGQKLAQPIERENPTFTWIGVGDGLDCISIEIDMDPSSPYGQPTEPLEE